MSSNEKRIIVRANCLVEFLVFAESFEAVAEQTDNFDCNKLDALPKEIQTVFEVVEMEEW